MIGQAATPPAPGAGVCSRRGQDRATNQDAALCGPAWFAVADGMGGRRAGNRASATAVGHLGAAPPPSSLTAVAREIEAAHRAVRDEARRIGAPAMGTTVAGVVPVGASLAVFHVGDSRCYQLVDGRLRLLTRDHSQVTELVAAGMLAPEAAAHHRLRHVVTRALGIDAAVEGDIAWVEPPGGRFLLCTDGVSGALDARTIGRVLTGIDSAVAAADRLVELAVQAGGHDDATALVVDRGTAEPACSGVT